MIAAMTQTAPPRRRRAMALRWTMLAAALFLGLTSCARTALLRDDDTLPVGSRVEFWVYHDDQGWVESNIHIAWLPRPMSGYETRLWADGVGKRDADMRWTHYRVEAHMPEKPRYTYRSRVIPRSHMLERELVSPPTSQVVSGL